MSNLGVMYDLGIGIGVASDPTRAVELYRAAADRGSATAQNNLGIAYALGRGVKRDKAQAVQWLGASAGKGLTLAYNTLGILYLIAGDERSGAQWLSRAVVRQRGWYTFISNNLARLYGGKTDDSGFGEWFWNTAVAATTGWPPVPADPLAAYKWFDRAGKAGFPATAPKRDLAEAANRAHTARWAQSFFSTPEHALKKEKELNEKIGRSLCYSYGNNDFKRFKKVLKNASKRFMDREVSLAQAYRYLRCYEYNAGHVDLIRVTVEHPMGSSWSLNELVQYFSSNVERKFLLGKILMCKIDFGSSCLNVFEHIERNLEDAKERPLRAEALKDFKRYLHSHFDDGLLKHDRRFCRVFFSERPEFEGCN